MKVDIRYKRLASANWVQYPISPEQYFDPLAESRSYEWDDVPRHLHAVEFLPVSPDGISETELKIWDPDERLRLVIGEVFWNGEFNRIIQRTEDNFTLLIVQLRQGEAPGTYHTIRLNHEGDGRLLLEQMSLAVTDRGGRSWPQTRGVAACVDKEC